MKPKIGFVGIGRMGANMARHLKDSGYEIVAVFDRNPQHAKSFAEEIGSTALATLAEVTQSAEIVFTVVTDDAAQRAVYFDRSDNLLQNAKGKVFINCATVSPEIHEEVERAAEDAGASVLEACMASSIPQARSGTLYLMCAGKKSVYERCLPVLQALSDHGKLLRYIGEAGSAAKLKALVNMVMNINTAGLAEGLGLAHALGLDLNVVTEVFSQTGAGSRVLQTDGEDMIKRDHDCFFSAAHAAKDSGIALALSESAGLDLPLARAAKMQYDKMIEKGLGELDKSGIAELTFPGRNGCK